MAANKAPTKKKPRGKPGRKPGTPMSDDHKAALAAGREASRAVKAYLEALDAHKPKRGRKRTIESITARLDAIEAALLTADPMARLSLVQEQLNLTAERASLGEVVDISGLEKAFTTHAKTYADNKGISYAAWRAIGIAPDVLRSAGINR